MSNAVPDPDAAPDDDRETQAHAPAAETARAPQENWLARAVRTLIGWRSGSTRSDLESLLETPPSAESGFSAAERKAIARVPAADNVDDLRLFVRLAPYFNGRSGFSFLGKVSICYLPTLSFLDITSRR